MRGGGDPGWLSRNGGWVLLGLGIGLIALSSLLADHETVASVFGFCGIVSAVFGVLLPRLKGDFVFSPTKFSATLTEAREVGVREDLTLEERADLILRLLDVEGGQKHTQRVRKRDRALKESRGLSSLPERVNPLPRPAPLAGRLDANRPAAVFAAFEAHVADAYREDGWELEEPGKGSPFDFVAIKDGERNYVEAKLSRRLSAADADAFLALVRDDLDPQENVRFILAVNRGALSKEASRVLMGSSSTVQVLEVSVDDW